MNRLPPITGDRRWVGLLSLSVIALGQASIMVIAAFATRDVVAALRAGDGTMPHLALAGLILAGVGMFVLRSTEAAVAERAGQSYAAAIRRKLFLHMSRVPVSVIAERRAGAMALRYIGDLNALKGWVSKGLARLISAAITIPAAFLILYTLYPLLALGAALPVLLTLIAILLLGTPIEGAHADLRAERARMAASMAERLPQALALRQSGRMKTELRALDRHSRSIAQRAIYRAWLMETVRALPDIASGVAGAICLVICFAQALPVEDAIATLTALALVVWPLRRLADVRNRQKGFIVAARKLEATLSGPTMTKGKRCSPTTGAPALELSEMRLVRNGPPVSLALGRGEIARLTGPSGAGKSRLLTMAAGLEQAQPDGIAVFGLPPTRVPAGRMLYLGPFSPHLKGSLRRELTMGLPSVPGDPEIYEAIEKAGLKELHDRLGGLSGQVAEGRRNLTSSEVARILLVRGLLAKPDLALIDADEIGLACTEVKVLIDHFMRLGAATLLVTADPNEELGNLRVVDVSGSPLNKHSIRFKCSPDSSAITARA